MYRKIIIQEHLLEVVYNKVNKSNDTWTVLSIVGCVIIKNTSYFVKQTVGSTHFTENYKRFELVSQTVVQSMNLDSFKSETDTFFGRNICDV